MLPLIGSRIVAAEPDALDDAARAGLAAAVHATRAHNLALEGSTLHVTHLLAAAGIPALPLKGPRLAEAAHGDMGLRPSSDIDLLVARDELDRAVELLRAEGYGEPADPVMRNGLPHLHYQLDQPDLPSVELHWRLHWYEEKWSAEVLARATPGPAGVLTATDPDLAASLLLYMARDGFHGLRLAADTAAWWDRRRGALGDGCLDDVAARHPALARPLEAAARIAERYTGVPRGAWLSTPPPRDRRVELACRLANWSGEGERDQLKANISLVDGLLAPTGSLCGFARRQVFITEEGAWSAHAAKMVARYAVAFARVSRGDWTPAPALISSRPSTAAGPASTGR